jgi:hypothetical protein
MSVKRLTADEYATYLIGLAIRRTLDSAPRDPEMRQEIDIVCRWIDAALTLDEYRHASRHTGWDFSNDENEEPPSARDTGIGDDPDIPF